jgi:hypothetical protein
MQDHVDWMSWDEWRRWEIDRQIARYRAKVRHEEELAKAAEKRAPRANAAPQSANQAKLLLRPKCKA